VPVVKKIIFKKNPLAICQGIFCFKQVLALAVLLSTSTSLFAQAKIKINESKKNFGFVKRGTLVKNIYEIENTGNQPLIITDAEVQCSCTEVEFPKQPILPGQTARISVLFNTTSVYGRQDRIVFIKSNADGSEELKLRFKGIVSNK